MESRSCLLYLTAPFSYVYYSQLKRPGFNGWIFCHLCWFWWLILLSCLTWQMKGHQEDTRAWFWLSLMHEMISHSSMFLRNSSMLMTPKFTFPALSSQHVLGCLFEVSTWKCGKHLKLSMTKVEFLIHSLQATYHNPPQPNKQFHHPPS